MRDKKEIVSQGLVDTYRTTLEIQLDGLKINGGNEACCCYPGEHLLKYDTRALNSTASAILPPSCLVELQYGAVRCYFPHLFLTHPIQFLKYVCLTTLPTSAYPCRRMQLLLY